MKKAQSLVGLQLLPDSEVIPVGPTLIESRATNERLEFTRCYTSKQTFEESLASICAQSFKGNKSKIVFIIDTLLIVSPDEEAGKNSPQFERNSKSSEISILQSIYEALKRELGRIKAFEIEGTIELSRSDTSGVKILQEFQTNWMENEYENSLLKLAEIM